MNGVLSNDRTESQVSVTVVDVNDNAPEFNQERYTVTIKEYTSVSDKQLPSFNMIVTDKDISVTLRHILDFFISNMENVSIFFFQEDYAYFELSFVNPADANAFTLSPSSGTGRVAVNILVNDSSRLDYERPQNRQQVLPVIIFTISSN